ncbi:hypothetical protein EMIHUDRAFT_208084 [Emiliania huxleyi CCMP1516]|uniref:Uncharacterized protein n=2 Tax=Emiliania huxleyi TaxID=2903 RepID=A0A0D3JBW4_EMIH1|nr:hypothetical protein EMIHUDRAFT_208084 [Emiliania huxleyi CCMP1516]EOD20999.1 hypothetical protein EMIHUDRAFT_208084 [Emiliania huxleyi CCMP1516]|eukprot:XP_005773428.1 hypothetical protein EMIHUDRAFT_208084 [Emiliania huxleyi CCMP1516]
MGIIHIVTESPSPGNCKCGGAGWAVGMDDDASASEAPRGELAHASVAVVTFVVGVAAVWRAESAARAVRAAEAMTDMWATFDSLRERGVCKAAPVEPDSSSSVQFSRSVSFDGSIARR